MSSLTALRAERSRVPAEPGIWLFILADMTMFALFFALILGYRSDDRAMFEESQRSLSQGLGFLNVMLLLLSSLLVVLAVQATRADARGSARTLLAGAMACGCGFAVVKAYEFWSAVDAGHNVHTNDFFMSYFVFTGVHLVHVLIGILVLFALWRRLAPATSEPAGHVLIEGSACYWHMVDLLWLILFPLLYLGA